MNTTTRIRRIGLVAITPALLGIGAASARAQVYNVVLNGASEVVPVTTNGTGNGIVTLDAIANTMRVQVTFSNLTGTTTASHIHSATALPGTGAAGVATSVPTFPGFPLGVTSGSYDQTFDMLSLSSYNPAFVTANGGTAASARNALFQGIAEGKAYLNIHTSFQPGGEIRGFLTSTVPEPGTFALALSGIGGMGMIGAVRARRRRSN